MASVGFVRLKAGGGPGVRRAAVLSQLCCVFGGGRAAGTEPPRFLAFALCEVLAIAAVPQGTGGIE